LVAARDLLVASDEQNDRHIAGVRVAAQQPGQLPFRLVRRRCRDQGQGRRISRCHGQRLVRAVGLGQFGIEHRQGSPQTGQVVPLAIQDKDFLPRNGPRGRLAHCGSPVLEGRRDLMASSHPSRRAIAKAVVLAGIILLYWPENQ
jgi:hypothetical protein